MKKLAIFLLSVSLLIPTGAHACWDEDWDDYEDTGSWDDDDWYDDYFYDDLYDDLFGDDWLDDDDDNSGYGDDVYDGGWLDDVVVTPDNNDDEDYDWGLDEDWWRTEDSDDDDYSDNSDDVQGWGDDNEEENDNNKNNNHDSHITGDNEREKYELKPTDHLVKSLDEMPSVQKQVGATCVTAIMEYLSKLLDGQEVKQSVFDLYYMQTTNSTDLYANGLNYNLGEIEMIISHFFEVSDGDFTFKSAIDAGYTIMTDIITEEEGNFHNVLIIGYNDNYYIAVDTVSGGFICLTPEDFANHYSIVITGKTKHCKN